MRMSAEDPALPSITAITAVSEPWVELELGREQVVVGDSVDVIVRLHHASGTHFELTDGGFDYSWIARSSGGAATTTEGALAQTTYRWTLTSLEAGERELPALIFHDAAGSAVETSLPAPPTLHVGSVLAETEDAPRPLVGFLEPTAADPGLVWPWIALPVLLALALAWWLARRRRARTTPPVPRATPLQRLAALEALDLGAAGEPGFATDLHVELTQLVREHFDLRAGASGPQSPSPGAGRVSLTDDEWLAAAALEFSEQQRVALHALLLESRAIKYGGATPTHWALQESLAGARSVLTSAAELEEASA